MNKNLLRFPIALTLFLALAMIFSSCQTKKSIEVYLASDISFELEERSFPTTFEDDGFHCERENPVVAQEFYLYRSFGYREMPDGIWISFEKLRDNVLHVGADRLVGVNGGEWGGNVCYYPYQVDWEAGYSTVDCHKLIDGNFVDFVHPNEESERQGFLVGNECYVLMEHAIFRFSVTYDEEESLPIMEKVYHFARENDDDYFGEKIEGGIWHDDMLYFVTTAGLFCWQNGVVTARSAQAVGFWHNAGCRSVIQWNGKLYANLSNYGIYEYDLYTGEESLYRIDNISSLVYVQE